MLLRDIPEPGESFRGFFQRIAYLNGYPNADWMLRHALKCRLHGLTRQAGAALLRIDAQEFARCDGVIPGLDSSAHSLQLGGVVQPEGAWRLPLRQICPVCLDDDGIQLGGWEHLDHVMCGKHGLILQTACPGCCKNLDWNRCGLMRCTCGFDLRELPKVVPSEALVLASRFITEQTIVLDPDLSQWTEVPVCDRKELVSALGDLATEHKRSAVTHESVREALEFAGGVFLDWPWALYEKLNEIDRTCVSIRGAFGHKFKRLKSLAEGGKIDGLAETVDRFVQDERITPTHPRAITGRVVTDPRRASGQSACAMLGTRHAQVARLVTAGRISGSCATAGRRRFVRVELSSVHRYRERRLRALSRHSVRDRMGLSRTRFTELCRASILPVLESRQTTGHAQYRLDCDAIETLSEELRNLARVVSACPQEGITLQTACRTRVKEGELAVTLRAILNGRLPLLGRLPGVPLIMSLIVDSSAHLRLLEHHRMQATLSFSIMEVAERMKVKQEVAYHLVNYRLLDLIDPTETRRRYRRVPESALKKFEEEHVWLRDLARNEGTSPKHLLALLARDGIAPVAGPTVDGCRQILFRRDQLFHWNPKTRMSRTDEESAT